MHKNEQTVEIKIENFNDYIVENKLVTEEFIFVGFISNISEYIFYYHIQIQYSVKILAKLFCNFAQARN